MSRIDGYSVYQNQLFDTQTAKNTDGIGRKASASDASKGLQNPVDTVELSGKSQIGVKKPEEKETPKLSKKAQELLEKLQKKYKNMDFVVANYGSDEEAERLMAGGKKEYSVLIEPELLEKMAADEDVAKQYEGIIQGAKDKLSALTEKLTDEEKASVKTLGISLDKDGKSAFYAILEKAEKSHEEWLSKEKENRKAEAAAQKKREKARHEENAEAEKLFPQKPLTLEDLPLEIPVQKVTLRADSEEDLLEQIRNTDWTKIPTQVVRTVGGMIDFRG